MNLIPAGILVFTWAALLCAMLAEGPRRGDDK